MLGKEGSLALIPRPEHCLPAIRKYLDTFGEGAEDYNGAHVLVLPYAPVPVDCVEELDVAASMGATVEYPDPNDDPTWPKVSRRKPADHDFNVALEERLKRHFASDLAVPQELPVAYIKKLAMENPRLLLAEGALDECDQVAAHRRKFVCQAVVALLDAVDGLKGRIHEHCDARGLIHAQSGGSKFTVTFVGKKIARIECYTHVKRGDKTTREAAARVYYTFVDVDEVRYLAILYAGPHPEGDRCCQVRFPEQVELP